MTPEQVDYYFDKLQKGGCEHYAFVIDHIGGLGSPNLGAVDPTVVGFGQDDDTHYVQYLHNWGEVKALIAKLESAAERAWGPCSSSIDVDHLSGYYQQSSCGRLRIAPVTGNVGIS